MLRGPDHIAIRRVVPSFRAVMLSEAKHLSLGLCTAAGGRSIVRNSFPALRMTTPGMKAPQFPAEQSKSGAFQRQEDAFRDWVRRDGSTPYPPEAGRYHLYVSLACPWAHRTIVLRKLKGLENAIGMTVVDPVRDERGWALTDEPDPINGFKFLREAY